MEIVNIHDAKTRLSSLIKRVLEGEEIVIAKNNMPIIELVKYKTEKKPRKMGQFNGRMKMTGTWEEMDKEVLEMFEESKLFPDEDDSN